MIAQECAGRATPRTPWNSTYETAGSQPCVIDRAMEETVGACEACQVHCNAPPVAPFHAWQWPTILWDRIHVDFLGPFEGKMVFVVVDAHS